MRYGAFSHMWFPEVQEECVFSLLPRLREMDFEGVEITLTPDLLVHCHFRASHRGILGDDHID
ncbi:hypothetical protein ACP6EK_05575 [Candidatus Caldatribacterium sp. SIUC1]|uniref:hypothetical protein n=1 Tax=Candidatus Caldatribacterium sp. SIUC1 TaxID=3418365 RepID=UPI003F68E5F9